MTRWWDLHGRDSVRSDFDHVEDAASVAAATRSLLAEWGQRWQVPASVTAVGGTTLALAFTEACLHIEQRPIPLRFAARFAVRNVLPSAVWQTISAHHIAEVANVPRAQLVAVEPMAEAVASHRAAQARRLIAIQSLRSARYVVGSYGLLWSVWRWHEQREEQRARQREALAALENGALECEEDDCGERVVRVALPDSALSRFSIDRHGDHIVPIAWDSLVRRHRNEVIDWSAVGLRPTANVTGDALDDVEEPSIKVVEIEIEDDTMALNDQPSVASLVKQIASAGVPASTLTIAIVSALATPDWHHGNGVDIYVYALSSVMRFLCDQYDAQNAREICLVLSPSRSEPRVVNDDDDKQPASIRLARLLNAAMIHRHGVPSSCVDPSGAAELSLAANTLVAVVADTTEDASASVQALVKQGAAALDQIVVLTMEDARASSYRASRCMASCAGFLSLPEASDRVLQQIRERVRAGESRDKIQQAIFREFGEQSALHHRADDKSDTLATI